MGTKLCSQSYWEKCCEVQTKKLTIIALVPGLQAEKNWISRPENSIEYRPVFEHWVILKWDTISRERASVYSTQIAKSFFHV